MTFHRFKMAGYAGRLILQSIVLMTCTRYGFCEQPPAQRTLADTATKIKATAVTESGISVSPHALDFGRRSHGGGSVKYVQFSIPRGFIERKLTNAKSGNVPIFVSTDPAVILRRRVDMYPFVAGANGKSSINGDATDIYGVRLDTGSSYGVVDKTVLLELRSVPGDQSSTVAKVPLHVYGEIYGAITPELPKIDLGLPGGTGSRSRRIMLTGSLDALKGVKVKSGASWLSSVLLDPQLKQIPEGKLQDGHPANSIASFLEVGVLTDAPTGQLLSYVDVLAANGECLRIPVTASITNR